MAKELPYFKFYPSEWIGGEITLENEKTQGLFISICAWYWSRNCKINKNFIQKRLIKSNASLKGSLTQLIEAEILKIDDNENVTIDFLDEQLLEIQLKHKVLSDAGRKGAEARLKGGLSNKDKDKDKEEDKDIPTLSEFMGHAKSKKANVSPESVRLKYESWVENGWKDGNDKKIKNWKSKLTNTIQYLKEDVSLPSAIVVNIEKDPV